MAFGITYPPVGDPTTSEVGAPRGAETDAMPEEPPQNATIPYVPMAQPTLSANVAHLTYGPAGFVLVLADQRLASGATPAINRS